MSGSPAYSTLEEHIALQYTLRSPPLQQTDPNFDTLDTPPPLVDAPEGYEPGSSEALLTEIAGRPTGSQPRPSLYDSILITALGPNYPSDIAQRAGVELLFDEHILQPIDRHTSSYLQQQASGGSKPTGDEHISPNRHMSEQPALGALRRASQQLNNALDGRRGSAADHQISRVYESYHPGSSLRDYSLQDWADKRKVSISVSSITSEDIRESLSVSLLKIQSSPVERHFENTPPLRPSLPSLRISGSPITGQHHRSDSVSESPGLIGSIISPQSADSSKTLPRIQRNVSPTVLSQSPDYKQNLPSLETALRELSQSNEIPYTSSALASRRRSPPQTDRYVPPPSLPHAKSSSSSSLSPPRFSSNPIAWRTLSHNSSNSNSSDPTSGLSSHSASTPATRQSPPLSVTTPQSHHQDTDQESTPADTEFSAILPATSELLDVNGQPISGTHGYVCTFPGCSAAPFQTQYLLNSHTNVHSNQRPHFCPVEGCSRGPGGQGFKRKNEMIRYVVLQSS